jgi:hypothetical protein
MQERDDRWEEVIEDQRRKQLVSSSLDMLKHQDQLVEVVQHAVRNIRESGEPRDSTSFEMEVIAEEIFSIVENAVLDSSAVLRLNMNRMDGQLDALQAQRDALQTQIRELTRILRGAASSQIQALSAILDGQSAKETLITLSNTRDSSHDAIQEALGAFLSRQVQDSPPSTTTQFDSPHRSSLDQSSSISLAALKDDHVSNGRIRSRRARRHRPTRLKDYMGKLFTRRESDV